MLTKRGVPGGDLDRDTDGSVNKQKDMPKRVGPPSKGDWGKGQRDRTPGTDGLPDPAGGPRAKGGARHPETHEEFESLGRPKGGKY